MVDNFRLPEIFLSEFTHAIGKNGHENGRGCFREENFKKRVPIQIQVGCRYAATVRVRLFSSASLANETSCSIVSVDASN